MSRLKNIINLQDKDLGFGQKSFRDSGRLITKKGDYNTSFHEQNRIGEFNAYYEITHMSWGLFFLSLAVGYILINIFFAGMYFIAGVDNLSGGKGLEGFDAFMYCFYFSTQTLTTVGFGKISPIGHVVNIIAAAEAMVGLVGFAFGTGITYGRFSKAKTRILFSKKAIIAPYKDKTALKVRIVNRRKNKLIGMKATMTMSFLYEEKASGQMKRSYQELPLEISSISLFPLPWTIVHAIDEESPLYEKTIEDLEKMDAELVIILAGYDDTFNQQVHRINSYKYHEFLFDHDFVSMFSPDEKHGTTKIFLDKLSKVREH